MVLSRQLEPLTEDCGVICFLEMIFCLFLSGFGWGFLFAVLLGGGEGRDYFAKHTTLKFARRTHVLGELPRNPE